MTSLPDGDAYLFARIRPAGGTSCAPTYGTDPGDGLLYSEYVTGAFSNVATYSAPAPGNYLVCAWLEDLSDSGPPASAVVSVRPAVLGIAASAPGRVTVRSPFAVSVNYRAEVPRYLTVLVARVPNCSVSSAALRGISESAVEVANRTEVSGTGSVSGTVRLDAAGIYLVCGFLEEDPFGSAAAQYVVQAATVTVSRPAPALKSCGNLGGRRNIRSIRARNVSCANARNVARRWGNRRRAPRRLGIYRCSASRSVAMCTAGARQVKFRFGRR